MPRAFEVMPLGLLVLVSTFCFQVRAYIAANHCSVRIFCFLVALALVASSVLGMINIFNLVFSPFQYLIGVYNFFFALTMVVLDGESSWFRNCCDCRSRPCAYSC